MYAKRALELDCLIFEAHTKAYIFILAQPNPNIEIRYSLETIMKTDELCHVAITSFHDELGGDKYPFEAGRYWLFTSKVCPFAHRTELARKLTGLASEIGLTIAGSVQTEKGWNIGQPYMGHESKPNPISGVDRLPDVYELASPGYAGRASVPVLFDTKTQTIVNNESAEILQQLDAIATKETEHASLYPEARRKEIDAIIDELNNEFISPIYRSGFAKDQQTYDENTARVFDALARLESHLNKGGIYLAGDQLTLADLHAYPHLSRFDGVYHSLYRLNSAFIRDYPSITLYLERLGNIDDFADTLDIKSAKAGYFLSWNQPTNAHFVPSGPIVNSRSGVAVVNTRAV